MTSRRFWRRNGATGWALSAPATLAVIGFLIVPIAAVIAGTFMDPRGAFAPYIAYFNSGFRTTVLFRTLQISAFTTIISLIFGFMTAYVVSRAPGKLKSLLIVAAVFPLLTGVVVRAFAWLIILGRNGILNQTLLSLGIVNEPLEMLYTQGAVIVGMVYLFVPLMVLSLVGVLENIPKDVLQASSSLGASPIATFWQVLLPLAVPGLIVGAVLVFTGSFTAYATPQLLGGTRTQTFGSTIQDQFGQGQNWPLGSAMAVLLMGFILIGIFVYVWKLGEDVL